MKKIVILVCLNMIVFSAALAHAFAGDDILGVWYNQDKDARIEIFKCGDTYCGKIVWLKEPDYPAGSQEGTPSQPKLDHNNPDPALRSRPVLSLVIMHDFKYVGDNLWKGGHIYDPKTGNTYRGRIKQVSPNRLDLRGYVGISLFGRTEVWTR